MDWISLTCVVVFIVLGQREGVAARKPTISSNAKDGMIQEGNELRIFCKGDGKLHFSVMEVPSDKGSCNHTINYGPNKASFVCHNATRSDTRWYACAKEGIVIRNTDLTIEHPDEDIAWIHIYVNSTEPFAQMAIGRELSVTETGPVVFPCRTTSPHWEVLLHTTNENLTGRFDPKIGFIATGDLSYLVNQEINCSVINEPRALRDMKSVSYRLADEEDADDLPMPKPEIDKIALHHMVWGRDQNINCTITVPLKNLTLQWKAPESVHHQRLITTRFTTDTADPMYTSYISELTIKNVTENDGGSYTCFIQEYSDVDEAADTCDIKFWDPNHFFVNVSMVEGDDYRSIVGKEGETYRWNIKVDAYPEYSLHWYKIDHQELKEINFNNNSKYSVSDPFRTDGGRNHLFEIHNSDVYDNGEYVIRVRTKYNMSDLNLNLTINVQPIPKITPNVEYVAPGQSMNFFCTTVSHPLANVTWRYMERPNYPSLDGNRSVTLSDYKELPNINAVTSESQLNIKINCTGHLICRSCNYINCVEVSKLIYVSDVNASFAIKPLESVVEGDNINITCGASVYLNFSSDEILKWNVNRSGRMRVLEEKTKFTHLSILQISGVTRLDDGIYICDVLDKSKGFKPQAYNLSVAAGRKPKIYEWNMNTSQLVIDTDKKRKDGVTLKCLSDGMPKPETTWLKNNKPLPEAHSYHISKSKSEFRIYSFIEQDSGLYTCQMVNRFGIDQRSVDIVVRGQSYTLWISLIGVLLIIIAVIVIYLVIDVKRQRRLKRELHAAGLTHFAEGAIECLNPDLNIDDQAELLPYDKKWEFPWERLKLGKQLGSGAFGVVMKAEAQGICAEGEVTTVAVKMVRRSADPSYMKALASELKIMAHLGQHLNVVNLLGACTKNIITKRELYVIVEYCRFGNLHNYLQRHRDSFINQIDPSTKKIDASIGIELLARRDSVVEQKSSRRPSRTFSRSVSVRSTETNSGAELIDYHENTDFADINMSPDGGILSNNSVQPGWRSNYRGDYKDQNLKPICTHDLLCWAWQVSRGMEYLSRRNVLHGDLAARNILLTDDNLVKICDFGLAKNMYKDDNYQKKGDSPLPIKWMAIESIRDRLFSTQSDIWSFGIVLWEFFTLAQTPYPGMDAEKQYHRLIEGYRMDKPEYATSEIYDFMQECWNAKPSLRPTFSELVNKLGDLLNESIRMHYSEQDDVYIEMNKRNLKDGQSDYLTMMSPSNRDVHDLAVQMMEPPPSSDYLPMSPMKTTKDPDIFSPRTKDCETHFDFPPTSNTAPINSNSEDSTESTPTQLSENSREEKTGEDPQEKRAESGKKELENSIIATDANYCNVVNNRPVSIPKNHFQDEVKDSYTNLMQSNIGNNYINFSAKLTNPDHRVNISQQKNNEAKNVFDSFSNPSYISIPQP